MWVRESVHLVKTKGEERYSQIKNHYREAIVTVNRIRFYFQKFHSFREYFVR